jgi:hypothetical protein
MEWMFPAVTALGGLLAGIALGRYMEWREVRWYLRKRVIRRRTRKMIQKWKKDGWTPEKIRASRFPRRPPPEMRPHVD